MKRTVGLAFWFVVACLGASLVLLTGQFVNGLWELGQARAEIAVCEDQGNVAEEADVARTVEIEEERGDDDSDSYLSIEEENTEPDYSEDEEEEKYD